MADPTEIVRAVDAAGNEHLVGRAWLERWPDDFTEIASDTPVSENPEPIQAKDTPISPVAKPVKEQDK